MTDEIKTMPGELYPGHAEDARKREDLASRIERAHAAVLPGALREAFAGEAPAVPGLHGENHKLQPVTLGLTANLERIKSPLLDVVRIMREEFAKEGAGLEALGSRDENRGSSATGHEPRPTEPDLPKKRNAETRFAAVKKRVAELKVEEEQIAETVFVFTRPQKRVRKLLDSGREKFREAVMEELGDKLHPAQMAALQRACAQHYVASFATIIGYGAPPSEEGAVVFPAPSPGAVTGSAGG